MNTNVQVKHYFRFNNIFLKKTTVNKQTIHLNSVNCLLNIIRFSLSWKTFCCLNPFPITSQNILLSLNIIRPYSFTKTYYSLSISSLESPVYLTIFSTGSLPTFIALAVSCALSSRRCLISCSKRSFSSLSIFSSHFFP